jgi:hypothetical protein
MTFDATQCASHHLLVSTTNTTITENASLWSTLEPMNISKQYSKINVVILTRKQTLLGQRGSRCPFSPHIWQTHFLIGAWHLLCMWPNSWQFRHRIWRLVCVYGNRSRLFMCHALSLSLAIYQIIIWNGDKNEWKYMGECYTDSWWFTCTFNGANRKARAKLVKDTW